MKAMAGIALCVLLLLSCQAQMRSPQVRIPQPAGDATIVRNPGLGCTTTAGVDRFTATSWRVGESQYYVPYVYKSQLQDFTIVKPIDECTPKLLQAIATGTRFQYAGVRRNNLDFGPLLIFSLQQVTVSSYQTSGSQSMPAGAETLTLHYSIIDVRVQYDGTNYSDYCYDALRATGGMGCTIIGP
jgi:type VI protein secretion system component Hcp